MHYAIAPMLNRLNGIADRLRRGTLLGKLRHRERPFVRKQSLLLEEVVELIFARDQQPQKTLKSHDAA
jgi:hypothetical protein